MQLEAIFPSVQGVVFVVVEARSGASRDLSKKAETILFRRCGTEQPREVKDGDTTSDGLSEESNKCRRGRCDAAHARRAAVVTRQVSRCC